MKNHISQVVLKGHISKGRAEFKDLKYLIRQGRDLDQSIADEFPLEKASNGTSEIKVNGSKELLKSFEKVNEVKLDYTEKLENIEYIGISADHEIIIRFTNKEFGEALNGTGTYDFSYDFLDSLFDMGKYSKFCIRNGYYDLLAENVNKLISQLPDETRQYRCLYINDKLIVRGITTTRYNNYDNNLVIYLTLLSLHNYAKEEDININLIEAHLTDSALSIFFEQDTPINLPSVGLITFGVHASNNEIKEGAFSLELRYTVVDKEGYSFSGITDSVFNIRHTNGIENIKYKLFFVNKIKQLQDTTLSLIKDVKLSSTLNDDYIYLIFSKVINSTHKLSPETRNKAKSLKENNTINNTFTIIEAFDRLKDITSNIDERLHLERIYNEILSELNN